MDTLNPYWHNVIAITRGQLNFNFGADIGYLNSDSISIWCSIGKQNNDLRRNKFNTGYFYY